MGCLIAFKCKPDSAHSQTRENQDVEEVVPVEREHTNPEACLSFSLPLSKGGETPFDTFATIPPDPCQNKRDSILNDPSHIEEHFQQMARPSRKGSSHFGARSSTGSYSKQCS